MSSSTLEARDQGKTNHSQTVSIHPISQVSAMQSSIPPKRNLQFWMIFVSLILPTFLIALDLAGVTTPLPIIVRDLHGQQFEWVGSAYALAATAFQPLCGGLAQVFGRRPVLLIDIILFAVGSAISGASPNLSVLILGRTIQGLGAGGIASMGLIIVADLVPLKERGTFNSVFIVAYAVATAIAPVVGGALAQAGQWRWLFYLNLPICGLSAALAMFFLKLKTPRGTWKEKINRLDWGGHIIVMASTTSCIIGLTWGGIQFPWDSPRVLVPLILGLVGLGAFILYEAKVPKEPLVPPVILSNRTAISGYIQSYFTYIMVISLTYFIPVYFQACKGATPTASGVDMFGVAQPITPFSFVFGIAVTITGRYRELMWFSWILSIVGSALLSTLTVDSSRAASIGYQVIAGVGVGMLIPSGVFPVLSSVSVLYNAPALAFYIFLRYFAQVWGVTIGGTALQNTLTSRLPADFLSQFPEGTTIAYAIIPIITQLDEPLQRQVRDAFAEGLRTEWLVCTGISTAGLITGLFMKGLPLQTYVDEDWGVQHRNESKNETVDAEMN